MCRRLVPAAAALLLALLSVQPPEPQAAPALPPQARLLDGRYSAVAIARDCRAQLALARRRVDANARLRGPRTFANTIEALENIGDDVAQNLGAALFLNVVDADPGVRAASLKCAADVADFFNAVSARPDLYAAELAAQRSNTARTPAERKLTELTVVAARRAGAGLSASDRAALLALESRITDLQNRFGANLADDRSTVTLTRAQTAPLPRDFAAALTTDGTGNAVVPVNESTAGTFMTTETDPAAREAFATAYARRGGRTNVRLLEQAIAARDRVARLLHYPNWSAYIAADRMAGSPARIRGFLDGLIAALLPKARAQHAELAAANGGTLHPWDVTFEQNALRRARYDVDRDAIKQYFPAPHVIDAVLRIYAHLLGLTFTAAPQLPRWDPAVLAYTVTDTKTGAARGAFYLDLYPRPGKYAHFENAPIYDRRVVPGGAVVPAFNAIVGNWPAPQNGKPALLSHADVITFFHEFGHNVAALCADTPYATLNGGFRWDFVEAPSQMLENFVWDPAILKEISSNVESGAPLPDETIAKMRAARYFDEAYVEDGQAFLATVDQLYHTRRPPVDTTAVWRDTLRRTTPNAPIDGTYPQASFGHLMAGYDAQYYGYLWSKVYAADMFTAFANGGLRNPAVGLRYRNDILAPARSIEPDAEVTRFLGRPMRPAAFYAELGIAVPH